MALARGVKRNEIRQDDPFRIPVLHQRLSDGPLFLLLCSYFCCHLFGNLFNEVIQYKKEIVWTKVLADLVGNFGSYSESKRTETSLAAIQHFVSDSSHVHCTVLDTCMYTAASASAASICAAMHGT